MGARATHCEKKDVGRRERETQTFCGQTGPEQYEIYTQSPITRQPRPPHHRNVSILISCLFFSVVSQRSWSFYMEPIQKTNSTAQRKLNPFLKFHLQRRICAGSCFANPQSTAVHCNVNISAWLREQPEPNAKSVSSNLRRFEAELFGLPWVEDSDMTLFGDTHRADVSTHTAGPDDECMEEEEDAAQPEPPPASSHDPAPERTHRRRRPLSRPATARDMEEALIKRSALKK